MRSAWLNHKYRVFLAGLLVGVSINGIVWGAGPNDIPVASGIATKLTPSQVQAATNGGSDPSYDPNFRQGTQSMYHRKANEVITQQIDVVLEKRKFILDDLDTALREQNPTASLAERFDLVAPLCAEEKAMISRQIFADPDISNRTQPELDAVDAVRKCFKQYVAVMGLWELKARATIGHNHDNEVRLQCINDGTSVDNDACVRTLPGQSFESYDDDRGDGTAPIHAEQDQKREQRAAYATAPQLAKIMDHSEQFRNIQEDPSIEMTKFMDSLKPDEGDFRTYEVIYSDSTNKGTGATISRSKGDANGNRLHNEAQLENAKAAWTQLNQSLTAQLKKISKKALKATRDQLKSEFSETIKGDNRSINRQIYDKVHDINVEYVNQQNGLSQSQNSKVKHAVRKKPGSSDTVGAAGNKPQAQTVQAIQEKGMLSDYNGQETINVPSDSGGSQPAAMGENTITHDPSARPTFKINNAPNSNPPPTPTSGTTNSPLSNVTDTIDIP